MAVKSIDHVAVPIDNVVAMRSFYEAFGFTWDASGAPRIYAVKLANQKLNFHDPSLWQNSKFTLRARNAAPGCGDFCFRWDGEQHDLLETIAVLKRRVVEGPVERSGGEGVGTSFYVRDPDSNLVEFICYPTSI